MTDRILGFTVVLEEDLRVDDPLVKNLMAGFSVCKGVREVVPVIANANDALVRLRLLSEFRDKFQEKFGVLLSESLVKTELSIALEPGDMRGDYRDVVVWVGEKTDRHRAGTIILREHEWKELGRVIEYDLEEGRENVKSEQYEDARMNHLSDVVEILS